MFHYLFVEILGQIYQKKDMRRHLSQLLQVHFWLKVASLPFPLPYMYSTHPLEKKVREREKEGGEGREQEGGEIDSEKEGFAQTTIRCSTAAD